MMDAIVGQLSISRARHRGVNIMLRINRRCNVWPDVVLLLLIATARTVWAQSNPVPLINQPLVPDAVTPGGQDFTLTVNGTGFVSSSVVEWDGIPLATTVVSNSELTASVPSTDIATAQTASVTVTNGAAGLVSLPAYLEVTQPTASLGFGQSNLPIGGAAVGVAAADLNSDGKLDLVFADERDGIVFVLLGNGNGTFQAPTQYVVGGSPEFLALGDFNRDGNLDLAVSTGGGFSVLLGNGDGTFQPPVAYAVGTAAVNILAGDFNGDGRLDIIQSVESNNAVAVLVGNGDGTFQNPVEYPAGTAPTGLGVGDFNGDGKLDLAVAAELVNGVAILLGNGDGSFQNFVEYSVPNESFSLVPADFNGDSKLDLAVLTVGSISMLLGNGDGTFRAGANYRVPISVMSFGASDLNGDGRLDLAEDSTHAPLYVFLGNGDGTFQTANAFTVSASALTALALGDFSGSGRPAVATADNETFTAITLPQVSSVLSPTLIDFGAVKVGSSSAVAQVTLTNTGQAAFSVSAVALTGSGKADFAQTNNCQGSTLQPGAECVIKAVFKPKEGGTFHATVSVKDTADNVAQTVGMVGVGKVH